MNLISTLSSTAATHRDITEGRYEDREEEDRSFEGHTFGVYMVRYSSGTSSSKSASWSG